jgi:uroporphyrinogen-III synthase
MAGKLAGVRIVVTRAAHQAEELAAPLRGEGATAIVIPLIGIAPPRDLGPLRDAARRADEYDWIVFTSANAVEAFAAELGSGTCLPARVAAVGSATREAAEARGFSVTLMPARYVAESLVEAFVAERLAGARVLIPRAEVARDIVPEELRRLGARVDVVDAYRNVVPPGAAEDVAGTFRDPLPDWVLFASSSAVEHLASLCDADVLKRVRIGTIGPVTSASVRKHGLRVHAEADPHTVPGMVRAVISAHMGSLQADS